MITEILGKCPSSPDDRVIQVDDETPVRLWIRPPDVPAGYEGGWEIVLESAAVEQLIKALGGMPKIQKKPIAPGAVSFRGRGKSSRRSDF
jgi:hypothetical protein